MALNKSIAVGKGYTGEYNRVMGYSYSPDMTSTMTDGEGNPVTLEGRTIVVVGTYKDAAARQAGEQPAMEKSYKFDGGDEPASRAACYALLKDHADFEDAIDC